jgi:iron complex transport system substrate-binding protein
MNPPPRIASLLPSATEILWALGVADRVVAVSHECDFPADVATRPRATRSLVDSAQDSRQIDDQVQGRVAAGQSLYELDAELLRRLTPELIVTQAQCDVCAVRLADVQALVDTAPELAGAQVLALQPAGLKDVFSDILSIGRSVGAEAAAEQYVGELRARIAAVQQRTDGLSADRRPRVACIEWTEPLMTAGNWVPELISLAGGQSCLAEAAMHSGYVSWEQVRACQPEVVIVAPCGFDLQRTMEEAAALKVLPGWYDMPAVLSGRCHAVDGNAYLNRSGPRLVESLEILAHLIQPKLFAPPEPADSNTPAFASL